VKAAPGGAPAGSPPAVDSSHSDGTSCGSAKVGVRRVVR